MTDKKPPETDPEQSEKFRKAVRDLEAAGELNPIEADKVLEAAMRSLAKGVSKPDSVE